MKFNSNTIESISKIIGDELTGSKITDMFSNLNIIDMDKKRNLTSTKWKRLNESINFYTDKKYTLIKIIEYVYDPQNFINLNEQEWNIKRKSINKILIFSGMELNDSGKVIKIDAVDSFSEAKSRLEKLNSKLSDLNIHKEVLKYCIADYLEHDYFGAVFEASKGISQRLRDMSNSNLDGNNLINKCFSKSNPLILIKENKLETSNEVNEYRGLVSLLHTIIFLYRNTHAHKTRLFNQDSETDAINALILISNANYLLDNCIYIQKANF